MQRRNFSDQIEENLIAIILGLMTIITFANVVVRYGFKGNILWALEATVFLFAWMVIIGASYAVKKNMHLGVDIAVKLLPGPLRRAVTLLAVLSCLIFTGLVLYGSFEYWLPFFGERAWYEVDDIPMPGFLQFLASTMNEGERWEKLPRFIPYFCLPLGFSLLLFRFLQVFWRVWKGEQTLIVASHEAED
ncbi:MAG: TRAP transporter small permease [Granulosicoccaceae bacterium]